MSVISPQVHLANRDKWLHDGSNNKRRTSDEDGGKKNPVQSGPIREERDRKWQHVPRWHCDCRREPRRSQERSLSQKKKKKAKVNHEKCFVKLFPKTSTTNTSVRAAAGISTAACFSLQISWKFFFLHFFLSIFQNFGFSQEVKSPDRKKERKTSVDTPAGRRWKQKPSRTRPLLEETT